MTAIVRETSITPILRQLKLGDVVERITVGHVGPTSEFYTSQGGIPS